jgi:hypothetical protein
MITCPLSSAKVTVQLWLQREPGYQPPSVRGRVLPLLRRRVGVEQCPRRRARDVLSPSRVRSAQPRSRPRQTVR